MSVSKFWKTSGWLAIAAATVITATPASAQDRVSNRGDRASAAPAQSSGGDRRDFARQRQAEQRAAQAVRQDSRQGNRQVQRGTTDAARQGNWQGNRQDSRRGDQTTTPAARQESRQGNWQRSRDAERRTSTPPVQVQTQRDRNDRNRQWNNNDRRGNDGWRNNDRRGDNRLQGNNNYRDSRSNYQRWDRRWRDNNRYDWNRYRNANRTIFRVGIYYAPYRNYSYRRMGVGYRLDSLFFSNRYWINDPWQYRLPAVYGPYRWVRYYDDVLLVDLYTGEVVDVIYDFFW
jgi:hypothetical protein